jgi:hypothetical protein
VPLYAALDTEQPVFHRARAFAGLEDAVSATRSMDNALYWIQPEQPGRLRLYAAKDYPMTYLDVVFRYGAAPGENELRAIDGMREVYGIRRVQFNEGERTVRVEFDASRLKAEAVARLLRQAGVDVRERLALA